MSCGSLSMTLPIFIFTIFMIKLMRQNLLTNSASCDLWIMMSITTFTNHQGCIFRLTCSYPELTKDHVLTSAYVKIFRTVTRNAVNNSA